MHADLCRQLPRLLLRLFPSHAAKDERTDCYGTRLIMSRSVLVDDSEELDWHADAGGCGTGQSFRHDDVTSWLAVLDEALRMSSGPMR
jgi:hypothetical protein